MKWLFILLLITNIAYFGWELDKQASANTGSGDPLPSIPIGAEELRLLSELPQPPEFLSFEDGTFAADNTASEQLAVNDQLSLQMKMDNLDFIQQLSEEQLTEDESQHCRTYGPITERQRAENLVLWMQKKQLQAIVRESSPGEKALFWVYLTARADENKAKALLDELKQKGVTDSQVIKRGRFKNAISLGLFSNRERVNSRLDEITEKGYKPVVVPYHKPNQSQNYWVDVQIEGNDNATVAALEALAEDFDSAEIACNDIALATQNP